MDIDLLKQLIEEDPTLITQCLAQRLGRSHTAVKTHPHELTKTWKYGVWISHKLSSLKLLHRVDACMELSTSHRNYQWLHNLIIGDEKWALCINYERTRQRLNVGQTGVAMPKTDLLPKKVRLSLW